MPEPTELPEYIRDLKDELEMRIAVEHEIADAISDTLADASLAIGVKRAEQVAVQHAEVEVQARLKRYGLERKRAGLG